MNWITTSTILQNLTDCANHAAWDRFNRRFTGPIVRFGRQMGLTEADAEEAAQETLLAFAEGYRKGRYDRTKGRLSRWLFGIAFRQALSKKRSVVRRTAQTNAPVDSTFWDGLAGEESAATVWDKEWQESILQICLGRVREQVEPATYRAFELVMRDGQTPKQAADLLGVPVKAVYNAKYTVLTRLRSIKAEVEEAL